MESFYGGRQGAPFVIKKKFKYTHTEDPAYLVDKDKYGFVSDKDVMAEYVKDPQNQDLWYNEYCIIDTTNKNNPNNGKIYRRTMATEAEMAAGSFDCAEYIGQIIGPSSGAAFVKPQSGLLTPQKIREELVGSWDALGVSNPKDEPVIYDPSFSQGELSQWPDNININTYEIKQDNEGLVPGYNAETGDVFDSIKFNWFNVRKNTEDGNGVVQSWCYIGFEVPYTCFTVDAKYKTPGTKPEVYEITDKSGDHPFWYDLMFEIPNGLRGVSVVEIFNNDPQDDDQIVETKAYSFDQLKYNAEEGSYTIDPDVLPILYTTKSWFAKLHWANPNPNGDTAIEFNETFYIGAITELKDVVLDTETGVIQCTYHNKSDQSWTLDYPKSITINPATGEYIVDYSDRPDITGQFGFVKSAAIDSEQGKIRFTNTVDAQSTEQDFIYPKSISMDAMGNISCLNSASDILDLGQLCFVDDVIVDDSHQLLIAYTDNAQIETEMPTVEIEGKTYYNYGQTIGKLGVQSASFTGTDIESILTQFTTNYPNGMVDGEVSGALHVVTTTPTDGSDPVSYFVMWDPDKQKWYNVSEIKAGGGVIAQIGAEDEWTYNDNSTADGAIRFVRLYQTAADENSFSFPWN